MHKELPALLDKYGFKMYLAEDIKAKKLKKFIDKLKKIKSTIAFVSGIGKRKTDFQRDYELRFVYPKFRKILKVIHILVGKRGRCLNSGKIHLLRHALFDCFTMLKQPLLLTVGCFWNKRLLIIGSRARLIAVQGERRARMCRNTANQVTNVTKMR